MNQAQLDLIPDRLLVPGRSGGLMEYLDARGLRMTLAELDAERRTRGLHRFWRVQRSKRSLDAVEL